MAEVDDTGFTPDTQGEKNAELDAAMLAAFPAVGDEFLDLTPDSYTGRTNTVLSEQLVSADNLAATLLDLLDPGQATGVFVDYHLRAQGTERKAVTFSKILGRLQGQPGALVGDKRVRYKPNESVWRTPLLDAVGDPLAIPANGILDPVTLTATEPGAINAVETGTSSWLIVDQVVGWDATTGTVESTASASLGTAIESDSEGRARLDRPETSTLGGAATKPAIVKALFEIDGVTDADINNNRKLIPDQGIPAKSIEAIVEGGDPQTICNTILAVYPGTANYFGNTTCTATATFVRALDGATVTITEEVAYTVPEQISVIARYTINYGRPEFAPDDQGVAIAIAAGSDYINTAGRDVDVIPETSSSAISTALPPMSEPTVSADVALKGQLLAPVPVPISIRQKANINPKAQAAEVTGTQVETFNFVVSWVLVLSVDNAAPVTVTFSATDFVTISQARALEIATVIGNQVSTLSAGVDEGAVQFVSNTSGAASSINILGTTTPALLIELGFSTGTVSGTDGDIEVLIV